MASKAEDRYEVLCNGIVCCTGLTKSQAKNKVVNERRMYLLRASTWEIRPASPSPQGAEK